MTGGSTEGDFIITKMTDKPPSGHEDADAIVPSHVPTHESDNCRVDESSTQGHGLRKDSGGDFLLLRR